MYASLTSSHVENDDIGISFSASRTCVEKKNNRTILSYALVIFSLVFLCCRIILSVQRLHNINC